MELKNLTSEKWVFIIDHPEKLKQGVHLWYKGVPYPRRVYHDWKRDVNFFLRTLNALGTVKKYLFTLTFLKSVVIPYRFSIKKYEPFLFHLYQQFHWTLAEFMIEDDEYSVPVWEIGKFIHRFLWECGLNMELAGSYARLVMMILEFDNAYRYRVQDMFGETTKELLKNPRKEVKRLLGIYLGRELLQKGIADWGAKGKMKKLELLSSILIFPKFKKAYLKALEGLDIEKIKFDDNDRFHFSFWIGYDYEGKTFEERFKPYEELYKTIPYQKKEDPELTANFMLGN